MPKRCQRIVSTGFCASSCRSVPTQRRAWLLNLQPGEAVKTGDAYLLSVAAPGVATENFVISLRRDECVLVVSGESTSRNGHLIASCMRELKLPRDADTDSEAVGATHARGIVTVSVPRRAPPP